MSHHPPRLVYVVTSGQTIATFLARTGQLNYWRDQGYEVHLVCSPDDRLEAIAEETGAQVHPIQMQRSISPIRDLIGLVQMVQLFRKIKPQIVNASTPKGGMLGMIAAWLLRVPVRIYLLRGLRSETSSPIGKWILNTIEKLTSYCSHHVIAVSGSLKEKYLQDRLTSLSKISVLGAGSSNGVNAERFATTPARLEEAKQLRSHWEIPEQALVVGFIGRLVVDKGIDDLVNSFLTISNLHSDNPPWLVLVGDLEPQAPPAPLTVATLQGHPRIIVTGFVNDPEKYYSCFDLFAFPSYREGFPNVPLEAAAAGCPVIGYRATGTVDAVVDEVTGRIVPLGDQSGLADAMQHYLVKPELRKQHGSAGRARVMREFQPKLIFAAWAQFYENCLKARNLPLPQPKDGSIRRAA